MIFASSFSVAYFGQGESDTLGATIMGLPSQLKLNFENDVITRLEKSHSGYGLLKHATTIELVSGVGKGAVLGSPLTIVARLKREKHDTPKGPRSGTADYCFLVKYKVIPPFHFYQVQDDIKVATGAIALKWTQSKLRIISWVDSVGELSISQEVRDEIQSECRVVTPEQIQDRGSFLVFQGTTHDSKQEIFVSLGSLKVMDSSGKVHFKFDSFDVQGVSPQEMAVLIRHSISYYKKVTYRETFKVKCPDAEIAFKIIKLIDALKESKDSVGGSIGCCIFGIPPGTVGVDSAIAATMFSLHNLKAFEVGTGFKSTKLKLSDYAHKDIKPDEDSKDSDLKIRSVSNAQGGANSGISSGLPFCFRVGFTASGGVGQKHEIVSTQGTWQTVKEDSDYEVCDVVRKVELIEGLAAISLIPLIRDFLN